MKERAQSLPSFSAWLNKGFDLRTHAGRMADARTDPEISPSSVFLALFHSFVFRLPSLQQLDSELSHSCLQHWIGAERAFRDDTVRYSLCGFDLDPLEAMLVDVNRRLKRGKAFDEGRVQGRLVAALDGIEVLPSFSRHCTGSARHRRHPHHGPHQCRAPVQSGCFEIVKAREETKCAVRAVCAASLLHRDERVTMIQIEGRRDAASVSTVTGLV
jgi:hypothetical protein